MDFNILTHFAFGVNLVVTNQLEENMLPLPQTKAEIKEVAEKEWESTSAFVEDFLKATAKFRSWSWRVIETLQKCRSVSDAIDRIYEAGGNDLFYFLFIRKDSSTDKRSST